MDFIFFYLYPEIFQDLGALLCCLLKWPGSQMPLSSHK